jgi:hypothetical protein
MTLTSMPRFVILRHETPPGYERPSHWDLMLESGGVLRTWALAKEPVVGSTQTVEPLGDHRIAYLDYEGPVSGGRGTVSRCDEGEYVVVEDSPARLQVNLIGRAVQAVLTIETSAVDERLVQLTIAGFD